MYCQNCGVKNEDGVKFCCQCGNKLSDNVPMVSSGSGDTPPKKNAARRIVALIITVLFVVSSCGALVLIINSSPEEPELFYTYLSDEGVFLSSNKREDSILLDESIVDLFEREGDELISSPSYLLDPVVSFYSPASHTLGYRANYSSDGYEYDIVSVDLNSPYADRTKVTSRGADISSFQCDDSGTVYFQEYDEPICYYSNNFEETYEVSSNDVWDWYICPQDGWMVYSEESDDEYSDLYIASCDSSPELLASNVRLMYGHAKDDVYVYSDVNGRVYTYIDGAVNELHEIQFQTDHSTDWFVEYCGSDGVLIFTKRVSYDDSSYEYTHYSYINGSVEEIPNFASVSDDGAIVCTLRGDTEESRATLCKYELVDNEYMKTDEYEDVFAYEITPYNDLLIIKNGYFYNDGRYSGELYYNDIFVDADVFFDLSYDKSVIGIDVLSEDMICYTTDMKNNSEKLDTYTLNIFDKNESKEIAYNVDTHYTFENSEILVYLEDRNEFNYKGTAKMYNGKDVKIIAEDVYSVKAVY